MPDLSTRIDAILQAPWEVLEYERWLSQLPESSDDYLFADTKARFEAHPGDRLRAPEDLQVIDSHAAVTLSSARLGGGVLLRGVKAKLAERLIALIDGQRTLAEIRLLAGSDRPALERVLGVAIGSVVFVPDAVSALERRLSGIELVRFVGTPYEIVRNYWINMASVRAHAEAALDGISGLAPFVLLLRRLHVIALLGEDLRTFYRPASRITRGGVQPGAFYETRSEVVQSASGALFLAGPRVGVTLTGGPRYHGALYAAAGDPEALRDRAMETAEGVGLGQVLTGQAVDDREKAAWFCPPRPLDPAHLELVFEPLRAALAVSSRDPGHAVEELSRFHYRFVRLHPFRCANQSLAMNLVNLVLGRVRGAGIPHLLLDQLALRLNEPAYTRVFRLAVETHMVTGSPEQRWSALRERKARAYALIQRLKDAKTDADARALMDADPDGARYALIDRA